MNALLKRLASNLAIGGSLVAPAAAMAATSYYTELFINYPGYGVEAVVNLTTTTGSFDVYSSITEYFVNPSAPSASAATIGVSSFIQPIGSALLDVDSFSLSVSVDLRIFETTTGLPAAMPPEFFMPTPSASWTFRGGPYSYRCHEPVAHAEFDVSFEPGYFVTASGSTMRDQLQLGTIAVGYSLVRQVPEPATAAMCLAGLMVVGFAASRRTLRCERRFAAADRSRPPIVSNDARPAFEA